MTQFSNSSLPQTYRPYVCQAGTFCLAGTQTGNVTTDYFHSANHCIEGRYCPEGTLEAMGILCTSGSYCPPRSVSPILAEPGYYTSGLGNVRQQPCEPGTYNNEYGATSCNLCPVGQFCGREGMVEADIVPCQAGSYRSDNTTIYCTNCPEGTYSGLTGAISK